MADNSAGPLAGPVSESQVNPSWTATVPAAAPPVPPAPPAAPSSPPPIQAGPPPMTAAPPLIPAAPPVPPAPAPPIPPSAPPAIPTTQPAPAPPPELAVAPLEANRGFPWRFVIAILVGFLVIGAIVGGLWYFGIGFGAPRNPKVALAKMAAAFAAAASYHTQGSVTVSYTAGAGRSPAAPAQAALPSGLARLLSIAQAASADPSPPVATTPPGATPAPGPVPSAAQIPTFPPAANSYGLSLRFDADSGGGDTSQATITADLTSLGGLVPATFPTTVEMDLRRISHQVFVRLPILSLFVGSANNHWLAYDLRDLSSATNLTANSAQTLTKLTDALTNARRVGYERLGPVHTAHYRAELPMAALVSLLNVPAALASQLGAGSTPATVEWWMGVSDHLPYQLKLTSQLVWDGATIATAIQGNYSHYGQAVTIAAPDPADVIENGLAGLSQVRYGSVQAKARDTSRKSDLAALKSALALYHNDHGSYPSTGGATARTDDATSPLQALVRQGYIRTLPVDPLADKNWYGYTSSDGKTYQLWSVLEDTSDPQGITRNNLDLYIVTP